MPCCSYCQSSSHNIIECNVDNQLLKLLEYKTCPDFFHMSQRILKKLASKVNIKTSLPKIQLACSLSQYYRKQQREKEQVKESYEEENCPICLDEFGKKPNNQSMTECGHKFCTSCLMQHLRKNNSCPCCRTQLLEERQPTFAVLAAQPFVEMEELIQAFQVPLPLPVPGIIPDDELEPGEIREATPPRGEVMIERNNLIERIDSATNDLNNLAFDANIFNDLDDLDNFIENIDDSNQAIEYIITNLETSTSITSNYDSPVNVMRQLTPETPRRRNRQNITLRPHQEHFSL
uniref:RING-type domain-containing protein n=1 Tax=viral metagenome TaxID=1070528 RepID=A0A6C0EJ42_9ZZZZ